MKDWEGNRIGDIVNCNPSVKLEKGKSYPLIDIDKIIVGNKYVTNKTEILFSGQSGSRFEHGDTLMARITPCLENGKIAQAKIEDKGIGSTELFVFRGIDGITDNDYVYYLFKQQYIRNLCANSMSGASGRQRADLKFIKNIKVSLPPIPLQRRIASILSAYDALIDLNTRRIRLLEQMAEHLYREWFVRFRFPNHENTPIVDGLPQGWRVETVDKFCKVFTGKKDVNQTIESGKYPFFSCSAQDYRSDDYIYDGKAILVAGNGNTGKSKFYDGKFDLYQRTYAIVNETDFIYYLYWRFKTDFELQYAGGSRGTAIPYIVLKNITKYKFVYNQEMIERFVSIVKPMMQQISLLQRQSSLLARQRDLLLPRLLGGKIEVGE